MRKILIALITFAFWSSFSPLHAQLLSINTTTTGYETTKQADNTRDWSIYTDSENRMLYVDFEKINVNLSSITVKDLEGKTLFKDETLWQLPVNTIYEIDFSKFPKGNYIIELKTFTNVLKKNVIIS